MRLIDADDLDLVPDIHNGMNGVIFVNHPRSGGRTQMIVQQLLTRMISNAPTIDAVPVVHGRWELYGADKRGRGGVFLCTACSRCRPTKSEYCPNCGAKMDLKEVNNEENTDPV